MKRATEIIGWLSLSVIVGVLIFNGITATRRTVEYNKRVELARNSAKSGSLQEALQILEQTSNIRELRTDERNLRNSIKKTLKLEKQAERNIKRRHLNNAQSVLSDIPARFSRLDRFTRLRSEITTKRFAPVLRRIHTNHPDVAGLGSAALVCRLSRAIDRKFSLLNKGEYQTTKEFAKRVRNKAQEELAEGIRLVDTFVLFAKARTKYNADRNTLSVAFNKAGSLNATIEGADLVINNARKSGKQFSEYAELLKYTSSIVTESDLGISETSEFGNSLYFEQPEKINAVARNLDYYEKPRIKLTVEEAKALRKRLFFAYVCSIPAEPVVGYDGEVDSLFSTAKLNTRKMGYHEPGESTYTLYVDVHTVLLFDTGNGNIYAEMSEK